MRGARDLHLSSIRSTIGELNLDLMLNEGEPMMVLIYLAGLFIVYRFKSKNSNHYSENCEARNDWKCSQIASGDVLNITG